MVTISAQDVKALRDRTAAGILDCRNALQEAGGDHEKAIDLLRTRGAAKTAKGLSVPTSITMGKWRCSWSSIPKLILWPRTPNFNN